MIAEFLWKIGYTTKEDNPHPPKKITMAKYRKKGNSQEAEKLEVKNKTTHSNYGNKFSWKKADI